MFLKTLKIQNKDTIIREISFHKGLNLIIDETNTSDETESGNNVGKTTVLRLIDYCLGGNGKNIYKDPEFKSKSNTKIEKFLKDNNIIISLTLKDNLDIQSSREILIRRNFLNYNEKIQEINNNNYTGDPKKEFSPELKKLIFKSSNSKPTFRQIISRNIRDEKDKVINTIKTQNSNTTEESYEAIYLFWLGIEVEDYDKKQRLASQRKIEEKLQSRLRKESTLPQIKQSLIIVNEEIESLTKKKGDLGVNEDYKKELVSLNKVKSEINNISTAIGSLEFRKELIIQSQADLESEFSKIDNTQVENLYKEAKILIPNLQKSFDDTLKFHNQMIAEKISYISEELPDIEEKINLKKRKLDALLSEEQLLTEKLKKSDVEDSLHNIISSLNKFHEQKGHLEEQKKLWEETNGNIQNIDSEIEIINLSIENKGNLIDQRVTEFNKFFSNISDKLYGEKFILSYDKTEKKGCYYLNIDSISGNLGTGKKKGQIAAFDLSYIQFADSQDINCLHFVLHDQIENIHDNQISNLLTQIVGQINCQYILPVLRDKLPQDIDIKQYEVLSLSQSDRLFKID